MIKNFFFKIYSIFYTFYFKFFCKNININGRIISNGFFNIEISKNAQLSIFGTITLRPNVLIAIRDNAKLTIKDGCFLNRSTSIVCRENIEIGKNSMFGENVKIYDNDHKIINGTVCRNKFNTKKIIIGNYCWIGNDVNILKGSIIKDKTIIGAMSLVKSKLSKQGVYAGIPAKLLSSYRGQR